MIDQEIVEVVGVYHADGGPVGEAKYVIGRLLGTAHCALCDVTHSPVRRKPEWDRMQQRLGLPITLLHLNELPADVAAKVETSGSPVVLLRVRGGALETALDSAQLETLSGSVSRFEEALGAAIHDGPQAVPPPG